MAEDVKPPQGFILDQEEPSPPEGFVLDTAADNTPEPPAGFQIDQVASQPKGVLHTAAEGLLDNQFTKDHSWYSPTRIISTAAGSVAAGAAGAAQALGSLKQTGEVLAGDQNPIPMDRESSFQQPLTWDDINPYNLAPKVTYMMGESSPMIAGGIGGELAGGPVGGVAGSAAASAAQQYGPVYADMRAQGKTHEEAMRTAATSAGISALFGGASYGIFRKPLSENAATNLALQMAVAQPATAGGEMATQNVLAFDRPWYEGVGQAAAAGVVTGGAMELGTRAFLPRGYTPDSTEPIQGDRGPDTPPPLEGEIIPPGGPLPPDVPPPPAGFIEDAGSKATPVEGVVDARFQDIPEFIRDRIKAKIKGNMEQPTEEVGNLWNPNLSAEQADAAKQGYFGEVDKIAEKYPLPQKLPDGVEMPQFPAGAIPPRDKFNLPADQVPVPGNDATAYDGEVARQAAKPIEAAKAAIKGLQREDGASATIESLMERYKLPRSALIKALSEEGINVSRIAGQTRAIGVKIREVPPTETQGNITAFPGTELPKFPRGPSEAIAQMVETDAANRISDKIDSIDTRKDPVQTARLNESIEQIKQKWDDRVAKRKQEAKINDLRGGFVEPLPNGRVRLLSSTDLESKFASQGNLAEPDKALWVDPRTLDANQVMADYNDMPTDASDPRIFKRGNLRLEEIQTLLDNRDNGYEALVSAGVRVAPSKGATYTYLGPIQGKSLGYNPRSGRSEHVMDYNRPGEMVQRQQEVTFSKTAFDYNKIDPNEYFVSLDINKLSGDPAVAMAVVMGDKPRLEQMAKDGRLPSITLDAAGRIVDEKVMLTKALPRSALVDSYGGPKDQQRLPVDMTGAKMGYGSGELKFSTPQGPEVFSDPRVVDVAKEIQGIVQDVYPAFAKVFERFGAKTDFNFEIEVYPYKHPLTNESSPRIYWQDNRIVLSTNWLDSVGVFMGDRRAAITSIIAHEMGHAFDLRVYKNLPGEIRGEINAAYHRELLRQGQNSDLASFQTIFDPASQMATPANTYHLQFQEWMAEQFRRFISADRRFNEDLSKLFGKGADSMSALMDTYKRIEGPYKMKQRFTPSFEFQKMADYVEAMARDGNSIIDMKIISDVMKYDWEAPDHTAIQDTLNAVRNEMENLRQIFAADGRLELNTDTPDLENGSINFGSHTGGLIRLMVGSLAWVKGADNRAVAVRRTMIHEGFHGISKILSDGQMEVLAKAADEAKVFTKSDEAKYRQHYKKESDRLQSDLDPWEKQAWINRKINEEKAAFYMEGVRTDTIPAKADSLAGIIRDFLRRIGNLLMQRGYNTHEDLVRSFFRGELTKRYNQKLKSQRKYGNPFERKTVDAPIKDLGDGFYGNVRHDEASGKTNYAMTGRDGKPVGYLLIEHKSDGPYVDMIEIGDVGAMRRMVREGKGRLSDRLINWAEEHMGVKIKSPQEYTKAGYKMAKMRDPDLVYGYTQVNGLWMSPKYIRDHYNKTLEVLAEAKADKWDPQSLRFAESSVRTWKQRFDAIPEGVFDAPEMHKQWSMREFELSGWEKARQQGAAEMRESITGEPAPKDPYMDIDSQLRDIEAAFNAKRTGYSVGAEPQVEMKSMRDFFRNANPDRETAKAISGQIAWGDKMWKVAKRWYTMRQMAYMNPNVGWLRNYIGIREQQSQRKMYHVSKADEIVKTWEKLHPRQADNLSKLLFWATEQKYLTAAERAAKVNRHPTRNEVVREARRLGLGREAVDVYDKIIDPQRGHMAEYLNNVEKVTADNYARLYKNNPQGLQTALNKLAADMNKMRARPYFPMSRFGSYSMVIKDAYGKTLHFETFESRKSRDAAVREAAKQYPADHIQADVIPEDARSFQGIPKPLLDQMMNDPTLNLTAAQRDWMQDFTAKAAPESSFRKRWLEREGTPGYSLDGMRAYADYFRRGSGYLARLEFRDALAENRGMAVQDIASLGWKDGRRMMLDMIDNHSEWMDKPGKDWVKLKTISTNFYLGGSFAAAFTNLTQPVIFTAPYLGSLFGYAKAGPKMTHVADAISRVRGQGYVKPSMGKDFIEAHAEMVSQGIIETGQAAELGVFADSNNLDKSLVGSNAQKAWRKTTQVSMWLFGKTERFNRELTFRAAYELAMENPQAKHVQDIAKWYAKEIIDLEARRPNISSEAAIATYVAKEAIQRTQFVYDSWDRPKFMRSGFMNSLAVFMSYPHQVLFSLRNNPGAAVTALMMLGLGGTSGMPGAEDLDNAINLVARKRFGKDFSLKRMQKDFIKQLFTNAEHAKLAADLLIHGIASQGYGLGLLPEGWGVPRFDAAASHSMGELIPGVSPVLKGLAASGTGDANDWKNTITDGVRDMAGAGYGPYFSLMQLMHSQPGTDDWKRWEGALPRSVKAMSKAVRYAYEEQEKNRNGAAIAKFDMRNPDDKATVIGQFLGFTPKKLTDKYSADQEFYDRSNYYKARQLNFIMDYKSANDTGNAEAKAQIISNIRAYNEELKAEGLSGMQISGETIRKSLQARARAKATTEAGLPQQKKTRQLWEQTHGPEVRDERVPKD